MALEVARYDTTYSTKLTLGEYMVAHDHAAASIVEQALVQCPCLSMITVVGYPIFRDSHHLFAVLRQAWGVRDIVFTGLYQEKFEACPKVCIPETLRVWFPLYNEWSVERDSLFEKKLAAGSGLIFSHIDEGWACFSTQKHPGPDIKIPTVKKLNISRSSMMIGVHGLNMPLIYGEWEKKRKVQATTC